jgi:hypothetical protein
VPRGAGLAAERCAAADHGVDLRRRALVECDAKTKIVILDCCFAGQAVRPAHSLAAATTDVIDVTLGTGAFSSDGTILASDDAKGIHLWDKAGGHPTLTETAWAPSGSVPTARCWRASTYARATNRRGRT